MAKQETNTTTTEQTEVKNTIETMLDTEEGRDTLRKMEELRQKLQNKKL